MTDSDRSDGRPGSGRTEESGGDASRLATERAADPHHATRETPMVTRDVRMRTKPGVRGFPDAPPGSGETAGFVRDALADLDAAQDDAAQIEAALGGAAHIAVIDASGTAGALAAVAAEAGATDVRVLEPSAAARTCAAERHRETGVRVESGWICDAPAGKADLVLLLPPADRGSARVHAELAGAAAALRPGGTALIGLHKDRGGKRYLKDALRWFGEVDTVGRAKGWRIGMARRPMAGTGAEAGSREPAAWTEFDVDGTTFEALPGVFAAGKLDPGTRILLDVLERGAAAADVAGSRVLDLGCGYGALGLWAARAGANVTAVDDDVTAVRSTERNAARHGRSVRAVHGDLDAELDPGARFDAVLCNPPFHVGKEVRLDVSQAFVRAAHRRLVPGGRLWLVANRALPYERYLDGWTRVETRAEEGGFKVVLAER